MSHANAKYNIAHLDFTHVIRTGPKGYMASPDIDLSRADGHTRQGSTRLHLDHSGAVNIMMKDLGGSGALWTIFAAEDTDLVRQFLRHKHNLEETSPCPIHEQKYYLQQDDLREICRTEGITPYIFTQYQGQAVFIPAGCAHQVR